MTDRVLTDAEMRDCHIQSCCASPSPDPDNPYGRAVEAAVLAKLKQERIAAQLECQAFKSTTMSSVQGLVTEREARTRERESYTRGWNDCGGSIHSNALSANLDHRYPLPTKTRPRTVTLSDGAKVNGKYSVNFAWAKTPADARLLADLVERPMEEVPDTD